MEAQAADEGFPQKWITVDVSAAAARGSSVTLTAVALMPEVSKPKA